MRAALALFVLLAGCFIKPPFEGRDDSGVVTGDGVTDGDATTAEQVVHGGLDVRTDLGTHHTRLAVGYRACEWDTTLVLDPMVVLAFHDHERGHAAAPMDATVTNSSHASCT